jgi:hypothetical protein
MILNLSNLEQGIEPCSRLRRCRSGYQPVMVEYIEGYGELGKAAVFQECCCWCSIYFSAGKRITPTIYCYSHNHLAKRSITIE